MGGTEEVRKRVHEEERDVGSRHHLMRKRLRVLCNSVILFAVAFYNSSFASRDSFFPPASSSFHAMERRMARHINDFISGTGFGNIVFLCGGVYGSDFFVFIFLHVFVIFLSFPLSSKLKV